MSVGPFVGNLLGSIYGGFLGDRLILFFAKRNKGYYEPEMRLYILHLPALTLAGGLIMFGTTVSRVNHAIHTYTTLDKQANIDVELADPSNGRASTGSGPV
ncbi:hypothetical protein GCM10020218_047680 [Dactylosporangium vinaceum]